MTKFMAFITILFQDLVEWAYYSAERFNSKYGDNEPFDPSWMDAAAYLETK